jgi:hypothetical protein
VCMYLCAYVHVCMCACVHMCICACVHVCMCACVHMCMCTYVRASLMIWLICAVVAPMFLDEFLFKFTCFFSLSYRKDFLEVDG